MSASHPLRIAVVGPECTGKTTLALALGERLGAAVVPEVAREALPALGRAYTEADLLDLARAQRAAEEAAQGHLVVCDTTLLVIRLWALERYGRVDPWIAAHDRPDRYALHLLCEPDLPWTFDPLREHPHDRPRLFAHYAAALAASGAPTARVSGTGAGRLEGALAALGRAGLLPSATEGR